MYKKWTSLVEAARLEEVEDDEEVCAARLCAAHSEQVPLRVPLREQVGVQQQKVLELAAEQSHRNC